MRYAFPDALRGLAALWVVLFHLKEGGHMNALSQVLPPAVLTGVFEWGHLGVPIFFVLSGYVMALTTASAGFDRAGSIQFMARRMVRLTPPYYVAVALALATLWVKSRGSFDAAQVAPTALAHLAYLQGMLGLDGLNPVFWSLCIEVQFYVVYALIQWALWCTAMSAQWRHRLWLGMGLFSLAWPLQLAGSLDWQGGFAGFWYAFVAGLLAFRRREMAMPEQRMVTAYQVGLLVLALSSGATFMVVVALTALALDHLPALAPGLDPRIARTPWPHLGAISYSLYLFHNPVTGVVSRLVRPWVGVGVWGDVAVAVATVGAALVVAQLLYRWVELPSMSWGRRHLPSRTAAQARG